MGNNRNTTVHTWHMTTTYTFHSKMCKLHLTSGIKGYAMYCVLFPHNSACVNDIVGHITPHQRPVKSKIHTPNLPVHPWLVISPEEVDKSHICVVLSTMKLRSSCPDLYPGCFQSHNDNMILPGKVFTKLPNILNNICKRGIWFKNTTILEFGAQVFLKHLSHSPPIAKLLFFSFLSF